MLSNHYNTFQPLIQQQRSIDTLPIPPTADRPPIGIKEFNRKNRNIRGGLLRNAKESSQSNHDDNFDLISPEFSGSFDSTAFDHILIHHYRNSQNYLNFLNLVEIGHLKIIHCLKN